jgi:hypothetical protein
MITWLHPLTDRCEQDLRRLILDYVQDATVTELQDLFDTLYREPMTPTERTNREKFLLTWPGVREDDYPDFALCTCEDEFSMHAPGGGPCQKDDCSCPLFIYYFDVVEDDEL